MNYWRENNNRKKALDLVIVGLISFILSIIVAFLFALIPGVEFNEYANKAEIIKGNSADTIYCFFVDDSYKFVNDKSLFNELINKKSPIESLEKPHKEFIFSAIYKEWDWRVLLSIFIILYGCLILGFFEDYYPRSSNVSESGIHAKLNYQRIADKKTRKLTLLMTFIITYVIFFALTIFRFASEIDTIIHEEDIEAYEQWIKKVETHINKDVTLMEKNTMVFWGVYFARFLLVRMLIAIIAILLFSFMLRLFNDTRKDRDLLVQKEKALSALHYISRGEWQYQYDRNGYALFEHKKTKKI